MVVQTKLPFFREHIETIESAIEKAFPNCKIGILENKNLSWRKEKVSSILFQENHLNFEIDFSNIQKTGFFLDQRTSRNALRQYVQGKIVLNCFSYTGGFGVYAAKHGATQVTNIDISKEAIAVADRNFERNRVLKTAYTNQVGDAFAFLNEMKKDSYDVIILDPPAFSKSVHSVEKAARGYKEINLKAMQKIKPDGILFTFSCSSYVDTDLFQKIIFGAAKDANRNVSVLGKFANSFDHPVSVFHREGEYLKGLILRVY